jgi:hypothetical protein
VNTVIVSEAEFSWTPSVELWYVFSTFICRTTTKKQHVVFETDTEPKAVTGA